jgi:hypothetical protein
MTEQTVVVFTGKTVEQILAEGGTSAWRLDRNHARARKFVVCARNAHGEFAKGPEPHRSAFLVGKISDVVAAPTQPERFLIQFSEYALIDVPDVWKGDRNPVKYVDIASLGIDPSALKWKPMPKARAGANKGSVDIVVSDADGLLTIAEAKRRLAATFGVSPEAVEITIRA